MSKASVICAALAMALTACGSGSHNSSRPGTVGPTAVAPPTDAMALAKTIGCKNPRRTNSTGSVGSGPTPLSSISCTLPDGATANIETYTPSALQQLKALVPTVGCSFAKNYGITSLYAVYGKDFAASIDYAAGADNRARAEVLSRALGTPLTSVTCAK